MKCDIFDYINVCRIEYFLVKLYNQVTSFQAHSAQFSIPQPSHITRGFSFWVPLQIWSVKLSSGLVIVQNMWWKKLYILGFEKSFLQAAEQMQRGRKQSSQKWKWSVSNKEARYFMLQCVTSPSIYPNYIVITIKYIHTLIYV